MTESGFYLYHVRTDNGLANTYSRVFELPRGQNLLIGVQFFGAGNTFYSVYDNGAVSNANIRLRIYSTAAVENRTCAMLLQGTQIMLVITTPSQGYFGMTATVQNFPAQERFTEKKEADYGFLPQIRY